MAATLADDTFKRKFVKENILISIQISLKFVSKGPINNMPALVQIMAWRRPGDKLSSEPMMIISLTHICVTRPQWVNPLTNSRCFVFWGGCGGSHWCWKEFFGGNVISPGGTRRKHHYWRMWRHRARTLRPQEQNIYYTSGNIDVSTPTKQQKRKYSVSECTFD